MNIREIIRPWSLLVRVRGLFLLYALIALVAPLFQVGLSRYPQTWQKVLTDLGLIGLGVAWVRGWRRGRFNRWLEPLGWFIISAVVGLCDTALPGVGLVFAGMFFRSLYGTRWDALRRAILVEAALIVPVLIRRASQPGFVIYDSSIPVVLAVLCGIMFVLKTALSQHERLVARERILAAGAGAVVAATDRQLIHLTAVQTALELSGNDEGTRTMLATGDPLAPKIVAGAGVGTAELLGLTANMGRIPPDLRAAFVRGEIIYLEGDECGQLDALFDFPIKRGAVMLMQLRAGGHELGSISIGADRPLRPEIRVSLATWAAQVSSSLEGLILNEELTRRAFHDPLTGLPNRARVHERLAAAVETCLPDRQVAFMLIDLDGFKPVNDQFGHKAGDELLCHVARQLSGCVRQGDTVGRLGGDEFAVVLPGVPGFNEAVMVAERLVAALVDPIEADGHLARVGASVGIAFTREGGSTDIDDLIRAADTAMYRVKSDRSGSWAIYDESMAS